MALFVNFIAMWAQTFEVWRELQGFSQNSCDMFRSPKSYFTVPRLMHFQYVLTSLGCIPINKCFRTKILLHIGIAYSILYYTPPKVPVTIVQHIQVACFENRLYAFHLMVNHQISSFSLLKSAYSGHIGGSHILFSNIPKICAIFLVISLLFICHMHSVYLAWYLFIFMLNIHAGFMLNADIRKYMVSMCIPIFWWYPMVFPSYPYDNCALWKHQARTSPSNLPRAQVLLARRRWLRRCWDRLRFPNVRVVRLV
jgi:hypothetical protein